MARGGARMDGDLNLPSAGINRIRFNGFA